MPRDACRLLRIFLLPTLHGFFVSSVAVAQERFDTPTSRFKIVESEGTKVTDRPTIRLDIVNVGALNTPLEVRLFDTFARTPHEYRKS